MRRVLVVCHQYPPAGGVGVLRTLKFTKYLPLFGFTPVVLTVRNRSAGVRDETLLEEVPREAKIISTLSAEHRAMRAFNLLGVDPKWFFLPDVHVGWMPFAVRSGRTVIQRERIDVIYATAPVFTSLLIGLHLKRVTGRPLVVDFRDPWTENAFTHYPTSMHRRLEEWMERRVLQSSDFVVTTTDEIRQSLIDKYPIVGRRCATIGNGFDESDFRELTRAASTDRFTLAYTGMLYGLRTAEHFLIGVARWLDARATVRGKIQIVFVGPQDRTTVRLVQELKLNDVVEITGFVAHRQSLQMMVDADALLLVMSQREVVGDGVGTMMIPGKTFEYLAARRPILALAPEGAVSDLIRETGSGTVVAPDDSGAIAAALDALYNRWEAGTLSVAPYDISAYNRKTLTGRLAKILESLCRR